MMPYMRSFSQTVSVGVTVLREGERESHMGSTAQRLRPEIGHSYVKRSRKSSVHCEGSGSDMRGVKI